jgi:hypothetical protein
MALPEITAEHSGVNYAGVPIEKMRHNEITVAGCPNTFSGIY